MKNTFIGGGNMATAIIGGLVKLADTQIRVVEPNVAKCTELITHFRIAATATLPTQFDAQEVVILAVKPQQLKEVCQQIAPRLNGALVLSIAAGVGVATLSRWLEGHQRIVRVMPNTPALVGLGISGLFAGDTLSLRDRTTATQIMDAVGSTQWVADEKAMDAITAISGSGPAYVFYLIEALRDAALAQGFVEAEARELALATFEGAVKLARVSGEDPAHLRANVTSKGGTTERAILRFDQEGVKHALMAGVADCRARSEELGQLLNQENH